jgi:outer membrane protein TolC
MKRTLSLVLLGIAVAVFSSPLRGDENKSEYGPAELVDLALKRSELLAATQKAVESARWSKDQSGAWQNPSFDFAAGNQSASGKNGIAYDVSVTQPFYFPGKQKLAGDIAGIREMTAGLELAEARLFVRYGVIGLSYQYAVATELTKHLEERVNRFNTIQTYLSSRPFPSPKKRMEKHVVEMKLVVLRKSLDEVRSTRDILWAKLNLFLDLKGVVTVRAPWFDKGNILDPECIAGKVASGNIDYRKRVLALDRIRKETDLARASVYPDFGVSVLYREERVPDAERFIGGGISFSVPLWNMNTGGIKSLEAEADAEKSRTALVRRETAQTLAASLIGYEIARKNLERLPLTMIDDVHARMADADECFNAGLIDLVAYGEVESQAFDMHLAVLGAQYEYVEKYIALLILQGSEDFIFPAVTRKNP